MTETLRCYLVRHGLAGPAAEDRLRPLTPAGRATVEEIGAQLARRAVAVAEIRHSALVRARETAEILGRCIMPLRGIVEIAGLAPEDDPEIARAEVEVATEPLMLVGHLPHLARLAALLVHGDARTETAALSPGTVVGLCRGPHRWQVALVLVPGGGRPA